MVATTPAAEALAAFASTLDRTRPEREDLYRHLHRHPELSLAEHATTARIHEELRACGLEPLEVGPTGTVAVVANGAGPVVAMRADIDALPIRETSGVGYASTVTVTGEDGAEVPVAHSCGHDLHTVALLGAVRALAEHRDRWSGTFVAVFQPAEEIAAGAQQMLDHGIADAIPTPDVFLAQHVLGALPAGRVGTRPGPVLAASDRIRVTVHGHGTHGSMAHLGVDPVVLAAAIVMRLQTVVAREVASSEQASVTVGSLHAGRRANIVPDSAELLVDTRAYSPEVRAHLREAVERVVRAECVASRSPRDPEFEYVESYPVTRNDPDVTARVRAAFDSHFGEESTDLMRLPASEDFSLLPDALGVPYCYWGLGGFADLGRAVANHDPAFAPDLQPTLDRGSEAVLVAACAWLAH